MADNSLIPDSLALVVDESTATDRYAKFVVQPFQSGFGHTIGNALRRVLLSSLEGSAIYAVRIDGFPHEFATVPNVVEDGTEIIVNLKKVSLILNSDKPKVFEIRKNKAGVVTAGDISTDGILQVICTLDKDTDFRAEIEVRNGRGWTPAEQNKTPDAPAGTIAIDSLFSPVTHVRCQVEATRLGEKTEMDSLVLEVETDGRVTAKDALEKAAKILRDHLAPFLGNDVARPAAPADPDVMRQYQQFIKPVEVLDLSVRAMNCLNNANIKLLGELCTKSESRMLKFRNFGKKSLEEIKEKLAAMNLSLGMTFKKEVADLVNADVEQLKNSKKEEA